MAIDYKIYQGDALDYIGQVNCSCVITDPPYPNNANHFLDGIEAAEEFCRKFSCNRWFVFWDEMTLPPVNLPLVAKHIWFRNNSNRPDNYETIYEFNRDGIKKSSRVFSFPVVYLNMTGMSEATGHPTQKNVRMIAELIEKCSVKGSVFDPFMGSGTTGVACSIKGLDFIGIEKDSQWFGIAEARIKRANLEPCDIPQRITNEKELPLFGV